MVDNPYTLVFGKEPAQMISRLSQASDIIDQFTRPHPSQQVYMITGVRGSGKTVFMSDIANRLSENSNWIVVELNPNRDLLNSLAARLANTRGLAKVFQSAKINLSFLGFGVEMSGADPITDIEVALERMLEALRKEGRRVLVSIDEASNSEAMRVFASSFQMLIRNDAPLYLLMTGLYENIYELQNEKNLTFLYRAPKVELKPLNLTSVASHYQSTFPISKEQAIEMARLTRGYPFAFQVLGYFTWEVGGNFDAILDDYRQYLEDYVYEKIWSSLSAGDRQAAHAIAASRSGKVSEVRTVLNMDSNHFTPYRTRLIRKGLLNGDRHGYLQFTLPLFEDYVKMKYQEW